MGKIVVLEGTDCSGKTTQYNKLCERLKNENIDFATDSFPDYESESSYFVREYLAGKYGMHPSDVDAKTASTFFSLDRYNSYKTKEWGEKYRNGGNVLFARYITSNVLHQACKLKTEKEKDEFVKWLYDFEVGILGIPKEDIIERGILLDSQDLINPEKVKKYKDSDILISVYNNTINIVMNKKDQK